MSYLAFTPCVVLDTTGLVANLVDFIMQLPDLKKDSIAVGLPSVETFVNMRNTNNSKRFGNVFSEQERARLNKFNHEIYAAYVIRQAQCKNVVWDLFLQQAITFQSEQIVLQLGDTLSRKFTDLPWWFALVLYSQACLAADIDFLIGERSGNAREMMRSQLVSFAGCVLERMEHLICDSKTQTTLADLIVIYQLFQSWSSRMAALQQRLTKYQQEGRSLEKSGKALENLLRGGASRQDRLGEHLNAQVENLQQGYARLLTVSPLTYFSTHFGRQPSLTPEVQKQLLENIARLDRSYGLQRWMAGELTKICCADSDTLRGVSELFMAVCAWAREASEDSSYLAYQWRLFLLYCYELFAVEHSLNKKSCFQNLPPACVGLADAFINLRGAFYEANQDPDPDGAKQTFLEEYRWYQEQDVSARLLDVFYEVRKRAYNAQ